MKKVYGLTIVAIAITAGLFAFYHFDQQPQRIEPIVVVIQGGQYIPNLISAKANQPIKLQILRKDKTGCAEVIRFPGLNLTFDVPFNQPTSIMLPPQKPGIYDFTCKGNKYQGKLTVL